MSKILAAMIAGLFAAGAYAQAGPTRGDPGADRHQAAAERAEMKKDAKPAGTVKAMGDTAKTAEGGGGVAPTRPRCAGEKRAETRDDRRRNKDGSVKRKPKQGGTPK